MLQKDKISVTLEFMRERLKTVVEKAVGMSIQTPRDFEWLSEEVEKATGEHLSSSTLKRLWGYMKDAGEPRRGTLDILARFLGYSSFETFCQDGDDVSSLMVGKQTVNADLLGEGKQLQLAWPPNRRVIISHKGGACFEVLQAENTKLSVGDTFVCHLFIDHEPLYLSQLVHQGSQPMGYVAGKRNGVSVKIVP